jgi:hypothetical protein
MKRTRGNETDDQDERRRDGQLGQQYRDLCGWGEGEEWGLAVTRMIDYIAKSKVCMSI